MGKTLGSIIGTITAPLTIIDKDIGNAISGAVLVGIGAATGNPALIALGVSRFASSFANTPRPETAETAIKTGRPPRVSGYGIARLYYAYALYETTADGAAVDVGAVHDGAIYEVLQPYLNDDKVTLIGDVVQEGGDGRYGNDAIQLFWTMGAATGTAFAAVTALIPDWDSDHRGDGVVTMAQIARSVKAKDFTEVYPNNVPVPSLAAKLQLCPDPRMADWTNPATWTWTENAVRHYLHYIIVREGVDIATKITPTLAYWQAACDDADSSIALKAGGTEPRYRSCVVHKHTSPHKETKAAILSCFDGWVAPRADGALVIYSGRYYEPDSDDLIGPSEIVAYDWSGVAIDDDAAVNLLVCSYISADHDYNTVECDAWIDEDDIAARGQELSQPFAPQVPSNGQVRRLAKRAIQRTNEPRRGTVTTNVAGRKIRGKRYIPLLIEEAGAVFYDGPAEITALTRNLATGGVTFTWIAADPNIDAWNPATEEGDPAPVGNRVAPEPLDAPVITSAIPEFSYDSGAGTQGVCIDLTVTGPDRADLTWFARTRTLGATVWGERQYTDIDPGATVQIVTEFVSADTTVEVEVAYQVGDGRVSPWSAAEEVDTSTAGVAPGPTTDVSATGGVGSITANWRNPASSNYGYTRIYYGTSTSFGSATALTPDDVAGTLAVRSANFTGIAPGVYYVWARAFSNSGVGATPTRTSSTITVT